MGKSCDFIAFDRVNALWYLNILKIWRGYTEYEEVMQGSLRIVDEMLKMSVQTDSYQENLW